MSKGECKLYQLLLGFLRSLSLFPRFFPQAGGRVSKELVRIVDIEKMLTACEVAA
jgi:hypothetical protein